MMENKSGQQVDNLSSEMNVLHFYLPNVEQCNHTTVLLSELSKSHRANFKNIQADKDHALCEQYQIESVPTIIILNGGKVICRILGADASLITELFTKHVPGMEWDTDASLHKLINQHPVMLFMKGGPEAPKCGFSRKIVQLLENEDIPFGTFDILTDERVRQELKEYSSWPTYPQLYINGELVGGLDIVQELIQNNELKSMLM